MKLNYRLGGILATVSAVIGVVGFMVLFLNWYHIGMAAPSAEPGCEILLESIHPLLTDFGLFAAVLFAVSAYGFFTKQNWAMFLSVVGIVLALLAAWFINVPYMAANLPPVYFVLFWPYLIIYFLFMRSVAGISWSRTLIGLLAGLAYIVCWMNGVSSTSRIITHGAPIFVLVQKLHFIAMIGWAVVTVGILMKPKPWMRVLGLVAGVSELVVGIPLTVVTMAQLGRFSLFALAPIICLILVIMFVWPGYWQKNVAEA
jgi:hypothetical protein